MDKIICLGKNYLDHAKELGDAVPEKPVLFLKPPSSAVHVVNRTDKVEVILPKGRGAVHFETEIVLRLGPSNAIEAVTLGLDLTLRDLQADLKKKGHPWEISKVFRGSAVIGPWLSISEASTYLNEKFTFSLEGQIRQVGEGSQMRFSPEQCIAYANEFFPLQAGDVIFTGTPAGVGPVLPGQQGELSWFGKNLCQIRFR
jgi:2-keto-4-pentenoate hydratase/2-oxohepta-3-ene-1,7-dioic acid hydratase in catechol pathway